MKIEVWSDYVCPFCYIGKRRLENALAQFPYKDQVEVEFKSFELDPNSPKYSGKNIHEALASKYGMSVEQAKKTNEGIGQHAASVGLTFNFDDMKPTNTFDAHRLAKYAKAKGKEAVLTEKLLHAYFTQSKEISEHNTLADIAEDAGLDRQEALNTLQDKNAFANDVRIDEAIAQQYGISGVPYFIINQKYAISGAQTPETFANALQKVWEEESAAAPKFQDLSGADAEDASCVDGNCAIPSKDK
ncbi:DsbA family oxidoreductase [Cytobacillus solani]|uniref:Disulfide bond formation protein DsbA n=1 Tax=Cytobacillus solani TaxID=1637975 RepID=A0A0Q3SFB0_9BACI|nr:DsbA family oxidoreductase [Cytobacillus solani]KOP71147.1 disulfide bond formation protein DsbA [Bacillus sp. FJAT-21945]KQL17908.1 disulfide bond formation protein DsbA [Cytobacillus solani]USK55730.1 DsbA family oxidoreductase [Cytobacillus solani]